MSMAPFAGPGAIKAEPQMSTHGSVTDASLKPKRVRTSKPKVKTGCSNCKQRRIKCDERRPSCSNCLRSKKECTGYPPPSRSARPFEEIRIAPKPLAGASAPPPGREPVTLPPRRLQKYQRRNTPPHTPVLARPAVLAYPSSDLPFDEVEGLYFQLFQEKTANELSGFFDSVFWTKTVLRECHSEPAIRHAVVALGALYKTLEKSTESPPGSPSELVDYVDNPFRHWEMAIKQYSHAINSLMASATAEQKTTHRTRLMASVLLACFDSFIGDHKQAIVQIQNGLGLLEQSRAERRRAFMPKPEEPVEDELIQMFTRLAIQAKSYDMAFHFPHPYVIHLTGPASGPNEAGSPASEGASPVSTHQDPIPERFGSLLEARLAWDTLCERIFRFTETMFSYAQNGPMGVLPASVQQYGRGFKDQIEAWSAAFEHILASRTAPRVSDQEKAGIAVLKMFQVMGQILFLMTFSDSEMQFDHFAPHFKVIVDLAQEVVGDEERRARAKRCPNPDLCQHQRGHPPDIFGGHEYAAYHIKPSFSADLGIVPPLFVAATKCRDPWIRRQAIQLLRSSSRREGMWDSELTARIGMWIAGIEEEEEEQQQQQSQQQPQLRTLTPDASPVPSQSRPSTSGSSALLKAESELGENVALGPGGNARWDARRESQSSSSTHLSAYHRASVSPQPPRKSVPAEKRVMVRAVEFDLRERFALVQIGSRGLPTGTPDLKTRVTKIMW